MPVQEFTLDWLVSSLDGFSHKSIEAEFFLLSERGFLYCSICPVSELLRMMTVLLFALGEPSSVLSCERLSEMLVLSTWSSGMTVFMTLSGREFLWLEWMGRV